MKTTMIATPTTSINGVPVDDLPTPIRNEIATFDRMRQEYLDAAYRLEVIHLAVESMRQRIAHLMSQPAPEREADSIE